MIAFVQPFGLGEPGGGARILRSLVAGAPAPCVVVRTAPWPAAERPGPLEVRLARRPAFGRLEGTRLAPWLAHVDTWQGERFQHRLAALCRARGVRVLHAIPHGPEFWHSFVVARRLGLGYALSVHDDLPYNLPNIPYLAWAMDRLGDVWREADARFVISEAMGEAYTQRYGARPYRVVTDGLTRVAHAPRVRPGGGLSVYLMGSIHISYEANFRALFKALGQMRRQGRDARMVTRGGFPFETREGGVPLEVRPWGSEADVQADLDEADLLYLPLPFEARHASFVRYSLATKMVTYLGSGLPVVYHGPERAAAGRLLARHDAALLATDPGPGALVRALAAPEPDRQRVAGHALDLADRRFRLVDQRRTFWDAMVALLGGPDPAPGPPGRSLAPAAP